MCSCSFQNVDMKIVPFSKNMVNYGTSNLPVKLFLLLWMMIIMGFFTDSHAKNGFLRSKMLHSYTFHMVSGNESALISSKLGPEEFRLRKDRCLQTGYWTGIIAGSAIGILHTYWSVAYRDSDVSLWRPLVASIPSAVISTYVGAHTTRWMTKQIMKGEPKPGKAFLKGAAYGAINGTIILAASYIPFFLLSHYLGTIEFNNLGEDWLPIKIVGMTILGSIGYGGTVGIVFGGVAGPCISWYMKF